MRLQIIYCMYKDDLTLNNLQWLICRKTQSNQPNQITPRSSLVGSGSPVNVLSKYQIDLLENYLYLIGILDTI